MCKVKTTKQRTNSDTSFYMETQYDKNYGEEVENSTIDT